MYLHSAHDTVSWISMWLCVCACSLEGEAKWQMLCIMLHTKVGGCVYGYAVDANMQ